jgi:putative redox protein
MPSIRVEFTGSLGHQLAGRLDTSDGEPRAWAVFAHCLTCSKDTKAVAYIARALAEAGFGVRQWRSARVHTICCWPGWVSAR